MVLVFQKYLELNLNQIFYLGLRLHHQRYQMDPDSSDHRFPAGVFDAADVGGVVGILIDRRAGRAFRVGRGSDPVIQRTGIVVDTSDLLLRRRGDCNRVVTAVNRGDRTRIDQDLIGAAEAVLTAHDACAP